MIRVRCFLLLLVTATPVAAVERTHAITPDDYFSLAAITEVALSPDAKHVAYTLATWDKSDDLRKTDLWIVELHGGPPVRLTFDRANDRHPKWSADGKWIYFLGNHKREAEKKPPLDGSAQVWRIRSDGMGMAPVTRIDGGVSGYDYAPKAEGIFFSKDSESTGKDDFSKLRAKFGKIDYGHGKHKVSEIHKLDLNSWRSEKLVDEKRYVREFKVTQDGKRIAMVSAFDDTVVKSEGESRVDVWEQGKVVTPPTDAYRKTSPTPWAWLENLAWSADGAKFAFCAVFDGYPAEVVIGTRSEGGWQTSFLKRPEGMHFFSYGTPLKWRGNDAVNFIRESSGRSGVRAAIHEAIPETSAVEVEDRVIYGFDVGAEKEPLPVIASDSTRFSDLGLLHLGGIKSSLTRVTVVNPQTATWKLPAVSHITWKAPDGTDVGGVLELPYGYKKGDKLPLVVAIHGGPTACTKADLTFEPHNGRLYFAAAGYAVLLPNYRGSTSYGDKFVTDLIGHENDIEVKDILAGIQHLIKEGIADPERIGVEGWSNGGYLTNCLISLKDSPVKFKAASSGAGIIDTIAEWGFNDEPAYPLVFKKGLPWEQPETYRKTSPIYGLGNVTTPTLIHVGGGDERCPPGHSRSLYRALNEYRKVPTEIVVYPGEPHGLTKMSHRKAKIEWDLAWFDKYLTGTKR